MSDAIKKLDPGSRELARAAVAQNFLESARVKHAEAQARRAEAFRDASSAGATQREIAKATGLTQPRVGQIIAGGAR